MPAPDSVTDLVRQHIRDVLEATRTDRQRERDHIAKLEQDGYRIVDGGASDRRGKWAIRDWRTKEVIAEGRNGSVGCDAAAERLDPGRTWFHIDRAAMDVPVTKVVTPGLPTGLSEALTEWVDDQRATDEELAGFVGWPVERVRECRSDHV